MRLIDADELKKKIENIELSLTNKKTIQNIIDNAPTVEAKTTADCIIAYGDGYETARRLSERPQGEWIRTAIYGKTCYECDSCHLHFDVMSLFCPCCGADMRGGAE